MRMHQQFIKVNIEEFRTYCLSKKGATESLPFGDNTLVFKVGNKIFALAGLENFNYANLKCDPEKAIELRETYEGIKPGYHMNKKHWISVYTQADVTIVLFKELIDNSYSLIVKSLPKSTREELQG